MEKFWITADNVEKNEDFFFFLKASLKTVQSLELTVLQKHSHVILTLALTWVEIKLFNTASVG